MLACLDFTIHSAGSLNMSVADIILKGIVPATAIVIYLEFWTKSHRIPKELPWQIWLKARLSYDLEFLLWYFLIYSILFLFLKNS